MLHWHCSGVLLYPTMQEYIMFSGNCQIEHCRAVIQVSEPQIGYG